jgi:hypothetical protein
MNNCNVCLSLFLSVVMLAALGLGLAAPAEPGHSALLLRLSRSMVLKIYLQFGVEYQ